MNLGELRMRFIRPSLLSVTLTTAAVCSLNLLTGCATGTVASISNDPQRVATTISGKLMGGQSPISGSTIQLWETSSLAFDTAKASVNPATQIGAAIGNITGITVTSSGLGYTTAPTVVITDSTGSGATATANVSGGNVTGITVNAGSSNYTAPTITLTGGVSNGGYGVNGPTLIASTTSAVTSGSFTFPTSNVSSNCTTGPYTYVTATGGDPTGTTATSTNSYIEMVAIVGPCASTNSQSFFTINELTTVAAAYALGNFAKDSSGTVSIGTSTTNAQGLADAIANSQLLVNSATGTANASTSTMLLPTAMMNSLGNILASCTYTTPSSSVTNCTSLMSAATPPGGTAPTDTFQAAMNIAKYPGNNVSSLLSLIPGTAAPFAGGVATSSITTGSGTAAGTAPIDLTLGIGFLNSSIAGAYESPTTLAIDKNDNVFVIGASGIAGQSTTQYATGTTQWLGEVAASSTGGSNLYTATSSTAIAGEPETALVDTNNNIWIGQNYEPSSTLGSIIEIPNETMANAKNISVYDPSGSNLYDGQNTWGIAVDKNNNIFTATYVGSTCNNLSSTTASSICEYEELPAAQITASTPTMTDAFGSGATREALNRPRGMFADANTSTTTYNGNVWSTNYASNAVSMLSPGNSSTPAVLTSYTASTSSTAATYGIALDKSSNAWVSTYTTAGLWEIPAGSAAGTAATTATASSPATVKSAAQLPSSSATQLTAGGLKTPKYIAIDGAGNIFVSNYGYSAIAEYSPSYNSNAGGYLSPYYGFSPSLTVPAQTLPITGLTQSATKLTVYAINNLSVGQTFTLTGITDPNFTYLNNVVLTVSGDFGPNFTAAYTHAAVPNASESAGVVNTTAYNQALLTCAAGSTTCAITNPAVGFNNNVVIDKAGSVWTLSSNGTAVEMIGLGAPTDPILMDGNYGILP